MPVLGLILPGPMAPPAMAAARSTALVSDAGVTFLTITSPEVTHTGLARRWVQVPRPGQLPILRDAGPQLRMERLTAIIYRDHQDISADLELIGRGHAQAATVTASYGRLEAYQAVISDLTIRTVQRVQGSNEPYWAELDIELTEKPPELRQITPAPVPSAAPAPAPPSSAAAPADTVTVNAGDSLWAIAQRVYGDGSQWGRIADANGIRDPRRLAVGAVLTIP